MDAAQGGRDAGRGLKILRGTRMMVIEQSSLSEIGTHLLRIGLGNHSDNMARLSRFERHCSVSLVEAEFLELVFLQSDDVVRIAPRGDDRTLRPVAKRAINLGQPRLADKWDLAKNLSRMRGRLAEGGHFPRSVGHL